MKYHSIYYGNECRQSISFKVHRDGIKVWQFFKSQINSAFLAICPHEHSKLNVHLLYKPKDFVCKTCSNNVGLVYIFLEFYDNFVRLDYPCWETLVNFLIPIMELFLYLKWFNGVLVLCQVYCSYRRHAKEGYSRQHGDRRSRCRRHLDSTRAGGSGACADSLQHRLAGDVRLRHRPGSYPLASR